MSHDMWSQKAFSVRGNLQVRFYSGSRAESPKVNPFSWPSHKLNTSSCIDCKVYYSCFVIYIWQHTVIFKKLMQKGRIEDDFMEAVVGERKV